MLEKQIWLLDLNYIFIVLQPLYKTPLAKKVVIEEQDLLEMLRNKTERGFSILYDNYSGALFGVILRIVEDNELAADLLQEAFVKIWNNIHQYDSAKGRLYTWMLNLTRNLCIDKLRSRDYTNTRKNQDIESSVDMFDAQKFTQNKPELIGVKSLVEKLSPEHSEIIMLMYFKGYTQSEIAEEFNIPLGTVKTRARAALNKLREVFDEKGAVN